MSSDFKTSKGTILPIQLISGKPYLQVAYRILWFHEEKPEWVIKTEFVTLTENRAICRAEILDENKNLRAMAHKAETPKGFADYIEKAETGAIGRALAMIGYGTQYATRDFDEGDRLADAPLESLAQGNMSAASFAEFDPATYVCKIGKYKGAQICKIGADELRDYIDYITGKAKEKGEPISGPMLEFIQHAQAYLGSPSEDLPF